MSAQRYLLFPLMLSLLGAQSTFAANDSDAACAEARKQIGEQIKEARLKGDVGKRAAVETRLHALDERCNGVVPLQPNHDEVERASRVATVREAQLREALGTGDPEVIELSKRRLDHARKQLEAAKR